MTKHPTGKHVLGPDVDLEREDVRDSQGRRITTDYAEQAAAEALDYVHRRRGRPSLGSTPGEHSPGVTFRLPAEERATAERVAAQESTT
ncbi:MAG: hypothetical protein ACRDQ1_08360, partial [Sciscionella sp.]